MQRAKNLKWARNLERGEESRTGQESLMGEVYHGGNLAAARLRFPEAPSPWLDLSTGINPLAYEVGEISPEAWTRLPEPDAIAALETAAAGAYGVSEASAVVAAPGAQALIQLLPRLLPARRVAISGPTYAEHEACWRAAGAEVQVLEALDRIDEADIAVVVNPNNPDGRLLPRRTLIALAGSLARKGGTLIVDEAFMDAEPLAHSLVPVLPPRTVLLRSFGKLYGLAGLRLGFAVAAPELAPLIRQAVGPWAASGAAIEIGCRAFADPSWRQATIARLRQDAARLDGMISRAGLETLGGTPLFRLAGSPDAAAWFERLGRAGILVRPFPTHPHRLRFGLPGREADWRRLAEAMR
jgi:cobalamin biosynthesis protein CobC